MGLVAGALIRNIIEGSPADTVGFTSGCRIFAVNGQPLRDILDWRWLSDDCSISLDYVDTDGDEGSLMLEREPGELWGFEFQAEVFDGIKTCRNTCTFCFMRQLPKGMRPSLYVRDDDYRLSFLTGTFVTLTNMEAADEARILEQRISPLRMSLHAISSEVRRSLIGVNEAHGIEVCERLLKAGIKFHLQIVLVPGINDGEELKKTLTWAYERPGVLGAGVVPLGFTKHQNVFSSSFNDPLKARSVLKLIESFQQKALLERGVPWVFAADEFYRNAYPENLLEHLPPTKHYGDFDMFEDGIGIIRATVDSWNESRLAIEELARLLRASDIRMYMLIGEAQREFISPLIATSPLDGLLVPLFVENDFFGGNVDVTGLLCGQDIICALSKLAVKEADTATAETDTLASARKEITKLVTLPGVIFNDDALTLDDMTLEDMQSKTELPLTVVSCNPSDYLEEMIELIRRY